MHVAFWGENEIQEFWSGASFSRIDHGHMLSYDLARILVEQFSRDRLRFKDFVLAAHREDAGAAAARHCLDLKLGSSVAALLDKPYPLDFEPDSQIFSEPDGDYC